MSTESSGRVLPGDTISLVSQHELITYRPCQNVGVTAV
jgi:hypothetical protein